jgi:hypothetical protein
MRSRRRPRKFFENFSRVCDRALQITLSSRGSSIHSRVAVDRLVHKTMANRRKYQAAEPQRRFANALRTTRST